MSTVTLLQSIKEKRRDALMSHYMTYSLPKELESKITNADSLYEYLLLDTKVSDLVKTTPIVEAINSLQLYINRCIEGHDGELTTEGNSHFETGRFLNHWNSFNKRYGTWAGKERLKYYAGTYINPSLRVNKTDLFETLEHGISQGRVTSDSVNNALKIYIDEYDKLTNLVPIRANRGNDESELFFVGRTKTAPHEYYWRNLTLRRNNRNLLIPDKWSQWQKISASIAEAVKDDVNIYWSHDRLHVQWQSLETSQDPQNNEKATNTTYMNDWVLSSSGIWSSFDKNLSTKFEDNYGSINNNQYEPPAGGQIAGSIALTVSKHLDLPALLAKDLDALFNYDVQGDDQLGGMTAFYGPFGLYLWEIFFHIPWLIAVRFQTEQRFEIAELWLKYIFNSTGYRDVYGDRLKDETGNVRYWNLVPLQKETQWDENLSIMTSDPHEIAMADPMQYKLAIFIQTVDLLINRGDNLYRRLEREALSEAKMYYVQANQLLGLRPEIPMLNNWPNPTLQSETDLMTAELGYGRNAETNVEALRLSLHSEYGHFLPPYNEELLTLWERVELRLHNLRHHLSLDGQPLHLPLYAEPMDPSEIQRRQYAGDGLRGSSNGSSNSDSMYRFPVVIDKARMALSNVINFGHALQSALERQDAEAMALLVQSQQQIVLQQTRQIQEKNLESLEASLEAIVLAKTGAQSNKSYYSGLLDNWISDGEAASLGLRSSATLTNLSSLIPLGIAGGASTAPNIFGLAVGGSNWGAIPSAISQGLLISANALDQTANIVDISENYRRRRDDWEMQRENADNQVAQLDAQILSTQEQIKAVKKQLVLAETEQVNAQAVYELQSTRFTSQNLYDWLVGRLSALYYQMYDLALPICWMAKNALEKELGVNKINGILTLPSWNDLYQGLLAGEKLMVELQKLDNVWLEENKRGMEAIKTVSLAHLIQKEEPDLTFTKLVKGVLSGDLPRTINGVQVQEDTINHTFTASLDLSYLGLDRSYNMSERIRTIKNLSVTLPTLLGPYQDIEATLALGNELVTLSHGVDDSGLFITDFNDSRYLPFEGMNLSSGTLRLSIFNTGLDGDQRYLLESLSDIIFHIRYVIK